ncbi:MAG: hypothetical protein IMZ53_14690 [Thermoplasmata archaeon]|nr:hypothetical protein [Thermoplasmata archaeon]
MISYKDLTKEQEAVICNGCGPKGGWVPVPEFFMHASCDHHDFRYWKGGSETDRKAADLDFLIMMLKDAGYDQVKQSLAFTYWMAVRLFGSVCFHYSDRERDEKDLAIFMEEYYEGLRSKREGSGPVLSYSNCISCHG